MQRQKKLSSSSFVHPTNLLQLFKRRNSDLPVYEERHFIKRPDITSAGSQLPQKLVHLIPVALLLCLFTLWWFSYPVNLEIKDGRITAVHNIMTQEDIPVVHLTSLSSISPSYSYTTNSEVQIENNGNIAEQASTKED